MKKQFMRMAAAGMAAMMTLGMTACGGSSSTATTAAATEAAKTEWIYRCGETACPDGWKPRVRA